MPMDLTLYAEVINKTLDSVAFQEDVNGQKISILDKSNTLISTFIQENAVSISDDDKAKLYVNFITNAVTTAIQQSILQAGTMALTYELDKPYKDAQIASMVIEDNVKEAQSAKDLLYKDAQIANMESETLVREEQSAKDLLVKDSQIESTHIQDEIRRNESVINIAKTKAEAFGLIPAQIKDMEASAQIKEKEIVLRGEEISLKRNEAKLAEKEIELKAQELSNSITAIALERNKVGIMQQEADIKGNELFYQRPLIQAQTQLAEKQASAVLASLETQAKIEVLKNEKDIKVAGIYVGAKV